jgi:hypothetical protein
MISVAAQFIPLAIHQAKAAAKTFILTRSSHPIYVAHTLFQDR